MLDITPDIAKNITRIAVAVVPMLLGMVLHEVAHGFAAYKLGDPTAKLEGRLTLNPLSHLDVTGTALFVLTALFSPFILGWAKPVPVQPRYFKNPRKGMMLISFAGPATNFILALVFAGIYSVFLSHLQGLLLAGQEISSTLLFLRRMLFMGIWINLILAWFNLLPIPTLDGGHILAGILPVAAARKFYSFGKYWVIVLVVLLGTGLLGYVMRPLLGLSLGVISSLFSIPPRLLLM
ncbi:site-2 protease family protein [Desulfovibrio sp. OttesenSCG-928-O18]|nr:site-2 protease family protein [Desulfovibrio sp. OttesenSCG-928-O18]